jgi:hypothetical protein
MARGLDGFLLIAPSGVVVPAVALCSFEGPREAWSLDLFRWH